MVFTHGIYFTTLDITLWLPLCTGLVSLLLVEEEEKKRRRNCTIWIHLWFIKWNYNSELPHHLPPLQGWLWFQWITTSWPQMINDRPTAPEDCRVELGTKAFTLREWDQLECAVLIIQVVTFSSFLRTNHLCSSYWRALVPDEGINVFEWQ